MSQQAPPLEENFPDTHHDIYSKTVFGFWVYLLTDFMLFATFFAVFAVLRTKTFGGPSGEDLFDLPSVIARTLIFLAASFCSGMGGVYAHRKNRKGIVVSFIGTLLLVAFFVGIQLEELQHFISKGYDWKRSAFLSAFFTLHFVFLLHVFLGFIWNLFFLVPVFSQKIGGVTIRRLTCMRMFWQFLNVVWIFIFTIVYLMGVY